MLLKGLTCSCDLWSDFLFIFFIFLFVAPFCFFFKMVQFLDKGKKDK